MGLTTSDTSVTQLKDVGIGDCGKADFVSIAACKAFWNERLDFDGDTPSRWDSSGGDGARVMGGGVAAAYTAWSRGEVLDAGLRFLPEKCDYRRVVETVRAYHRAHPAEADFRACREMIAREFSDEEYPGGYHICLLYTSRCV